MSDVKGPAVDPDAFRVEGHCCAIRLPGMATLSSGGSLYQLTPEVRAYMVKEGILPLETAVSPPSAVDRETTEKS